MGTLHSVSTKLRVSSNLYRAAYAFLLCVVLAVLALSHSNDSDFALIARKNYCNLFHCWTEELNTGGLPVGEAATAPTGSNGDVATVSAPALDTEQIASLETLAPRASAVSQAANALQDMLDPRTTSIILKAQNDLDQQLAQGQVCVCVCV